MEVSIKSLENYVNNKVRISTYKSTQYDQHISSSLDDSSSWYVAWSHKKDARLIWVKTEDQKMTIYSINFCHSSINQILTLLVFIRISSPMQF